MTEYPKLRWPIEMRIEKAGDQEVLLLRCPLGVTPEPLLLIPATASILTCFNGKNSIDDIAERFSRYGVGRDLVVELAKIVDSYFFLDNANFRAAEQRMRSEYLQEEVRKPALAGGGYPAAGAELGRLIEGYLNSARNETGANGTLAGLIAPHIDYRRGGPCYGVTYRTLAHQHHDVYVILGVAHMYSKRMFHMTKKDFGCPLGAVPCERSFVDRVAGRYGTQRSFEDEILHRSEHSIELQIPFLRKLRPQAAIAPILVGSFHHLLHTDPAGVAEYNDFAEALAEAVREEQHAGKRVCVIAAVDMAHIGNSFGDTTKLNPEWLKQVEQRDKIYLDAALAQDKRKLLAHVAEDDDQRRLCGFPAVYTTVDVLERVGVRYTGELLDYRQAVDYATDCAVTLAGAALWR